LHYMNKEKGMVTRNNRKEQAVRIWAQIPGPSGSAPTLTICENVILSKIFYPTITIISYYLTYFTTTPLFSCVLCRQVVTKITPE